MTRIRLMTPSMAWLPVYGCCRYKPVIESGLYLRCGYKQGRPELQDPVGPDRLVLVALLLAGRVGPAPALALGLGLAATLATLAAGVPVLLASLLLLVVQGAPLL